jgi:hypothetical protein
MINKSRKITFLSLMLAAFGIMLVSGNSSQVFAQRDPFSKNAPAAPKSGTPKGSSPGSGVKVTVEKPKPLAPAPVALPAIQDRIAYFKRLREAAATQNQPLPKVTSVLSVDELSVTGIFRTPRGYAAMIEAKPIKLSYTIYPGEKFFDGQLVAIEENRLVFRRVTKWSNGKFVASEENKALRQFTVDQEVQGTAPTEPAAPKTESAKTENPNATPQVNPADPSVAAPPVAIVSSPLEEMNKQPTEQPKDSAKTKASDKKGKSNTSADKKSVKKTVKVAKNKDQ